MTTRLAAVLALLVAAVAAAPDASGAGDVEARFRDANAAFAEGDYEAAAASFQALVDAGFLSTAILYDLANAESKAGRTGAAILGYERALALSPRDPDVAANLRQTRAAAHLDEPERGRGESIARWLSVDEWAGVAAAGWWAACLLLATRALRTTQDARGRRGFVAAAATLLLLAGAAVTMAWTRLHALERSVVVGESASLRVAPFDASTSSSDVAPGAIVDVERSHDDFVLVRTRDGRAGWLPAADAPRILLAK